MFETMLTALVAYINPLFTIEHPDVPVVFNDQPFDWNNVPDLFVEVMVEFYTGKHIEMGMHPHTRYCGVIYVNVYVKQGRGSLPAARIHDWFASTLGYQAIGPCRIQAPAPMPQAEHGGFLVKRLGLNFYADET